MNFNFTYYTQYTLCPLLAGEHEFGLFRETHSLVYLTNSFWNLNNVMACAIALFLAVFLARDQGTSSTSSGSARNSISDVTPPGGPDDEERRRLLKKILIGLGVVTAAVGISFGLGYFLCEVDWLAIVRDPKLFWTSVGGALGVVATGATKPEMVAFLKEAWVPLFERLASPEGLNNLLGDLEFPSNSALRKMYEEICHISKNQMIRAVLQAHPDGAPHSLLEASLEKALTCEIQTIALKYATPLN